jgi:hypothetical protein
MKPVEGIHEIQAYLQFGILYLRPPIHLTRGAPGCALSHAHTCIVTNGGSANALGGAKRAWSMQVLAKIESADAVECLEDILDAVDGAMVARGDLGAELPVECVPFWQSSIIQVLPPKYLFAW